MLTFKLTFKLPSPLIRHLFILFSALSFASAVGAHEYKLGDIQIKHPYARATVQQQTSGGAYLELENKGKAADKLTKVDSSVAKSVEMHSMEMAGDVMKMRQVDYVTLNANSKINMKPGGGYHLMLIGLKRQLNTGDKFPLTLYFEKAGKIEVVVNVEAPENAINHSNHSNHSNHNQH